MRSEILTKKLRCPVCREVELEKAPLETDLNAAFCRNCTGKWVVMEEYLGWRNSLVEDLPEKPAFGAKAFEITEIEMARLCPKCARILLKFRVGHDVGFLLDRCGNCGGVWFDRDEWEILRDRNLHDNLQEMFLDRWQSEVRQEETRRRLEQIYEQKFGADDFARLKEYKQWIDAHFRRDQIIAFLTDENPLGL